MTNQPSLRPTWAQEAKFIEASWNSLDNDTVASNILFNTTYSVTAEKPLGIAADSNLQRCIKCLIGVTGTLVLAASSLV